MRNLSVLCGVGAWLLGSLGATGHGEACTGLLINRPNVKLMAVNYDWDVPGGRLIVNQRGIQKIAMVSEGAEPLSWVSSLGSLTFNQYGRDFPIGGLNQMGLAMQVLWLAETIYPAEAPGPAVSSLQWVQYCLDSFGSVQQVVASAEQLAISSRAPLHFFACDRSGACAVIEFLEGKPAIRAVEKLPLPVLANSTYYDSIKALDASLGYGGKVAPAKGDDSLSRFVRAATQLNLTRAQDPPSAIDRAFEILADVAIAGQNQWRVVYDLQARTVHFTTADNTDRRSLFLGDVELHCAVAGPQSVGLSAAGSGSVAGALSPLTTEQNVELVKTSVARTKFLDGTPDDVVLSWGRYPETLSCTLPVPQPTPTPSPDGPFVPPIE